MIEKKELSIEELNKVVGGSDDLDNYLLYDTDYEDAGISYSHHGFYTDYYLYYKDQSGVAALQKIDTNSAEYIAQLYKNKKISRYLTEYKKLAPQMVQILHGSDLLQQSGQVVSG